MLVHTERKYCVSRSVVRHATPNTRPGADRPIKTRAEKPFAVYSIITVGNNVYADSVRGPSDQSDLASVILKLSE